MKFSHVAIGLILFAEALLLLYSSKERYSFHHFFAASKSFSNISFWKLRMLTTSLPHLLNHLKSKICYGRHYCVWCLFFNIWKQSYFWSPSSIFMDDLLVWYNLQAKHRISQIIFNTTIVFNHLAERCWDKQHRM